MDKNIKQKKQEIKFKLTLLFRRLGQFFYITIKKFSSNFLWESASACSFGFIFSFIPVVLIILTVLVTLLKFSPTVLNYIMEFCTKVEPYYDFKPLVNNLLNIKSISIIHIFLGIWVVWMARKLFKSIVQGIRIIFRSAFTRKMIIYQLFAFLSEFVVVILFAVIIVFTFTFDKFLEIPIFDPLRNALPTIFNKSAANVNILISVIMYFMFFIFTFYCYRFVSGTKPRIRMCFFYSGISIGAFFIVSSFLNKFMNINNYSLIYGTVGTIIMLLFKVYMFFIIFFFCGEMVYVSQFFDNLLISQIYIIPEMNLSKANRKLCDFLFENPVLVNTKTETISIPSGTIIYDIQEIPTKVFYICNGIVKEGNDNITVSHNKGDFFGDLPPILHKNYKTTAIADTDCEIMLIDVSVFLNVIKQNSHASGAAIKKLNKYSGENKIL